MIRARKVVSRLGIAIHACWIIPAIFLIFY